MVLVRDEHGFVAWRIRKHDWHAIAWNDRYVIPDTDIGICQPCFSHRFRHFDNRPVGTIECEFKLVLLLRHAGNRDELKFFGVGRGRLDGRACNGVKHSLDEQFTQIAFGPCSRRSREAGTRQPCNGAKYSLDEFTSIAHGPCLCRSRVAVSRQLLETWWKICLPA